MLRVMRKFQRGWGIKIIFGLIIAVFVLYFGYGSLTGDEDVVAQIGPHKVRSKEFRDTYNRQVEFYKNLFKDGLDDQMIKTLKIKEKVLDQITDKYVLLVKAGELGLSVGDREFSDFIDGIPAFKKDGKFNKDQYVAVLRSKNFTPEQFEDSQRQGLLVQKVLRVIQDTGASFSEADGWAAYVKEKGSINLGYAEFDPSGYREKVSVSEKELNDAYEKEKSAFRGQNIYHLKDVVVDEKSSVKDDVVYMELLKTKDADAYGKEKGLTVVDLGAIREGDLDNRFKGLKVSERVRGLKQGDVSLPLREGAKSHIFQVVSIEEGKDLDKNVALGKIKEKLIAEKAKTEAKAAAEKAIRENVVKPSKETGLVPRNSRDIANLGTVPPDYKGVFALTKQEPVFKKAVELSGKHYVFVLKDEKLPDKQEWEKDKESYMKYISAKMREESLKNTLEAMRSKVKIKINEKAI